MNSGRSAVVGVSLSPMGMGAAMLLRLVGMRRMV